MDIGAGSGSTLMTKNLKRAEGLLKARAWKKVKGPA
jgi:hypothetical protein